MAILIFLMFQFLVVMGAESRTAEDYVVEGLTAEDMSRLINDSRDECYRRMNETEPPTDGLYCEMTFDDVMCWNYTPAGQLALQNCPDYISRFRPSQHAIRHCMPNGQWFIHPRMNKSWTDFDNCISELRVRDNIPTVITNHIYSIQLLAQIGYSISLAFLLFAVFIMIYFKKLHCQRNTIHINLFLSCILRASVCLLKQFIFVENLGLPMDIEYDKSGKAMFIQEGTHWQCKLLMTVFQYSIVTNYMWVFVEGLYLHNLIFFTVFSQKTIYLLLYMLLGWSFPVMIILPWVIVRILLDNTVCWNIHSNHYYWIVRGPIIASICINFFFFLNIIRVLFTKLMTSITREPQRYRKLAKSTLVLIPLFGCQYILFIILISYETTAHVEVVTLYAETFLNAFQGAIVTILFCFLNGEVKTEIRKLWNHYKFRGRHSLSRPSSRNFNTTSSFVGRDRAGSDYNQSVIMVDLNRSGSHKTSPFHNGDATRRNCNGSAYSDTNTFNSVCENTSLLNSTAQGGQPALMNSQSDKQQLSTSPENAQLLSPSENGN